MLERVVVARELHCSIMKLFLSGSYGYIRVLFDTQ
jgi:hypothetical protein